MRYIVVEANPQQTPPLIRSCHELLQFIDLELLSVPGQPYVFAFLGVHMPAKRAAGVLIVAGVRDLPAAITLEAGVYNAAPVALDNERPAGVVVGDQAKRLALRQVVAVYIAHTAPLVTRSWIFKNAKMKRSCVSILMSASGGTAVADLPFIDVIDSPQGDTPCKEV